MYNTMILTFRLLVKKLKCSDIRAYANYDSREAKMLQKMLNKSSYVRMPQKVIITKSNLPSAYNNEGSNKRTVVLNKIYMEHINTMLCSGTFGSQFSSLGIQFTKVKISSAYNFLNIYWIQEKTDVSEEVVNIVLEGALKEMQAAMGSLTFTRRVPYLKFVKDVRLEREMKLEKIFEMIDCGKEFEPVYPKKVLTSEHVPAPGELPKMRQNVLGLDVAAIQGKISAKMFRANVLNRNKPSPCERVDSPTGKLIVFSKKEFFKFYKRRRIAEMKMKKKAGAMADTNEFYENDQDDYDYNIDSDNDEDFIGKDYDENDSDADTDHDHDEDEDEDDDADPDYDGSENGDTDRKT